MYHFIDYLSKKQVYPEFFVFSGNENPWEVIVSSTATKLLDLEKYKKALPSITKYLPFLPILDPKNIVSVGEIPTPLIKSKDLASKLGIDLYFKIEGKNPTGSFKDRGSLVDITVAKELGAKCIVVASTGNMAASCCCYAAAAKIPCFAIVPVGVPLAKMSQVIAYGGQLIQIEGNYNEAIRLAHDVAKEMGFFLAGDYAFRVEGQKMAAFELLDQLLYEVPDQILIPMGSGTNMAAYAKGFREYKQLGLIKQIPRLIGIQAEGASPIFTSFKTKSRSIIPIAQANTIASAIAVENPLDGIKALDAIYESNGMVFAVTDKEILQAQKLLASSEGLFVESASAATVASLIKLKNKGKLSPGKIVCILTGDGLKDSHLILQNSLKNPIIAPTVAAFSELINTDFFLEKIQDLFL